MKKSIPIYLNRISTSSLKEDRELLLYFGKILKFGNSDELVDIEFISSMERFFTALYIEIDEGNSCKDGLDEEQRAVFEELRAETLRLSRMTKDYKIYSDYFKSAMELGKRITRFAKQISCISLPIILIHIMESMVS